MSDLLLSFPLCFRLLFVICVFFFFLALCVPQIMSALPAHINK